MFYLDKQMAEEMLAHAREEAPNECVGLLLGSQGKVMKLYRATNSLHSPMRYNIEPKELLQIHRELDEKEWDIVAIYHSHTHTKAYPSPTDVQLAFWPDSLYLIISLQEPDHPTLLAFQIKKGQVSEEQINIVERQERLA